MFAHGMSGPGTTAFQVRLRTLCWQRPCGVGTVTICPAKKRETHREVKGRVQSHIAKPVETELGSIWLQSPPYPNHWSRVLFQEEMSARGS